MKRISFLLVNLVTIILIACSDHKNRLFVLADNVNGIFVKAEVKVKGAVIGKVAGVKMADKGILIELDLDKDIRLPVGTTAVIEEPLVGSSAVLIILPIQRNTFLQQGDTIIGHYQSVKMLDEFMSDTAKSHKIQQTLDTLVKLLHAPRVVDTISKQ